MTVGFKTETSNEARFFSKPGNNKVLKLDLLKMNDVQEIDY